VPAQLPLPALLSQTLVAFTIEFDNDAERRVTQKIGRPSFLVSLPFWANSLRFIDEKGLTLGARQARAVAAREPVETNYGGFERWGYVILQPKGAGARDRQRPDAGFGSARGLGPDSFVRASRGGEFARSVWKPLMRSIEKAWAARCDLDALRSALQAVSDGLDAEFPRSMPMLTQGMRAPGPIATTGAPSREARTDVAALLAQVLLAFTHEYESEMEVSLPIASNALRVLDDAGVPSLELPARSGVSKEALSMCMTVLKNLGMVHGEAAPGGRGKLVRPTGLGISVREDHARLVKTIEQRWRRRLGASVVGALRDVLEALDLSKGLVPSPTGWRARKEYLKQTDMFLRDPRGTLPHYPMVLHRGAWPDGA
jgi:hypothetical protein